MKQKDIFDDLLARVVQLSIDVKHERELRLAAERRLAEAAAPQIDPRLVHALMSYMLTDRRIEAIKAHRALTGFGLKDSKEEVDAIMNRFVRAAVA